MNVAKRCVFIFTLIATGIMPSAVAQNQSFTTASAGNWTSIVAPDSIAAGFGLGLATATTSSTSLPLPSTLGSTSIMITDSNGIKLPATMFLVSPGQINYLIPATAAVGKAAVSVSGNNSTFTGSIEIANVSPAIFTANNNGAGVPAAQVLQVGSDGKATVLSPYRTGVLSYITNPIDLSSGTVYLILYGTGIRRHSAIPVKASLGGVNVPVQYAGAQGTFPGLDQINLGPLPRTLASTGASDTNLFVTVDGVPSNVTRIAIK